MITRILPVLTGLWFLVVCYIRYGLWADIVISALGLLMAGIILIRARWKETERQKAPKDQ